MGDFVLLEEELTMDSFLLLTESHLEKLGFKMGDRVVLNNYIKNRTSCTETSSTKSNSILDRPKKFIPSDSSCTKTYSKSNSQTGREKLEATNRSKTEIEAMKEGDETDERNQSDEIIMAQGCIGIPISNSPVEFTNNVNRTVSPEVVNKVENNEELPDRQDREKVDKQNGGDYRTNLLGATMTNSELENEQACDGSTTNDNFPQSSISEVKKLFERTLSLKEVPNSFLQNLVTALKLNQALETELLNIDALPFWNIKSKCFTQEWSIADVSNCLNKLDASIIIFSERFQKIFGEYTQILTQNQFLEVNNIIETPKILKSDRSHFHSKVYSYLLQKIRMWGCHELSAQKLYSLIDQQKDAETNRTLAQECSGSNPVARIDFLTFLLGTADCVIACDIIKILSKFIMAMPLVVCDLQSDRYVLLLPLYKDVTIKWEAREGQIMENYLFRSPFKMIISVRVGDNESRSGKSVILNEIILKRENCFSSRGEPGGKYGKPCTVNGSVEFIWLTKETSSDAVWTEVLQPHYASGTDELILLANLHGDINEFTDFLEILEALSPSYLVFVMPSISINSAEQNTFIKNTALLDAILIYVDPDDRHANRNFTYATSMHYDHDNKANVINALKQATKMKAVKYQNHVETLIQVSRAKRVVQTEQIHTKESQAVIGFVNEHGCKASKQLLKTSELINKFQEIFNLSTHEIRKAISHLETELSYQTSIDSLKARERVQTLRRERLALVNSENRDRNLIELNEVNMNNALTAVDESNLGIEHFFREGIKVFESSILTVFPMQYIDKSATNIFLELPTYCADLLLNGIAIELLNGDDQQLSAEWLNAVCNRINKKQPNMRIFVVSIIGLQSSGKSTLLNALFSCNFAVSVGRCSRGLFMRLAFLNENLRDEFGFDAFLLIDSEGLGSPDKINDKDAAQKDRRMATLAMGISNLTIINVMGEAINAMTEILQIAMVAMTRLDKVDMESDILLVQHLLEKNGIMLLNSKDSFYEALKEAFNLTRGHSTDIGALGDACLSNLMKSVQNESCLKRFNAFKEGSTVSSPPSEGYHKDVVDLNKRILTLSNKLVNKPTLLEWSKMVGFFWNSAKDEKFALRFKNAKELDEFCNQEQKLELIRTAVFNSYSFHCRLLENQIRQQVKENNCEKNGLLSQIDDGLTDLPKGCAVVSVSGVICDQCKKASDLIDAVTHENTDQDQKTVMIINSYSASIQNHFRVKLSQIYDAMVIEERFCDRFGEIINNELNLLLKTNQTSCFTDEQRQEQVVLIWNKLILSAGGKIDEPIQNKIQRKIETEIRSAYQNNKKIMESYKNILTVESFDTSKAFARNYISSFISTKHPEIEANNLLGMLCTIVRSMLEEDKNLTGFEPRMIHQLKNNIDEAMNKLESELNRKFDMKYRRTAHAYALQLFTTEIKEKQQEWDLKHNPQVILQNKKAKYMNEIDTRLKLGFSAAADGHIVAQTLNNAMHKQAQLYIEQQLVDDFRKQDWVSNIITVRLKYFEGLAKEIAQERKKRAINHFLFPTFQIEDWFREMTETYDLEQIKEKYVEHYEESKTRIQIVLFQKIMENAEQFMQNYLHNSGEEYLSSHNVYTKEDESLFLETIIKELSKFKCVTEGLEQKIVLPSKNEEIMNLLGCTECCPICHALCWMSRGHTEREYDENQAVLHRSCHQPVGLAQIYNHDTMELRCIACPGFENDHKFRCQGKDMKWYQVKQLYPNWDFRQFHNNQFQELMNWFMSKLNADIAAYGTGLKPASTEELERHACVNLEFESILADIYVVYLFKSLFSFLLRK